MDLEGEPAETMGMTDMSKSLSLMGNAISYNRKYTIGRQKTCKDFLTEEKSSSLHGHIPGSVRTSN